MGNLKPHREHKVDENLGYRQKDESERVCERERESKSDMHRAEALTCRKLVSRRGAGRRFGGAALFFEAGTLGGEELQGLERPAARGNRRTRFRHHHPLVAVARRTSCRGPLGAIVSSACFQLANKIHYFWCILITSLQTRRKNS